MTKEQKPDPTKTDDDQQGAGDKDGKGGGSPTVEDLKNLQKVISEKDLALRDAKAKLAEIEKNKDTGKSETEKLIASLKEDVTKMSEEVKNLNTEKRRERLAEKYPDILPGLIIGKSDEEIEKIVESQRALSKKLYGDSQYYRQPTYGDESDVDKAIELEKKDTKKTGMETAVEVLKLNRLKGMFNKE